MGSYKTKVPCPFCSGSTPAICGWCDENGEIVQLEPEEKEEHISLQVVSFVCGVCHAKYQVELREGDMMMVACCKCDNASLQMVRGTP